MGATCFGLSHESGQDDNETDLSDLRHTSPCSNPKQLLQGSTERGTWTESTVSTLRRIDHNALRYQSANSRCSEDHLSGPTDRSAKGLKVSIKHKSKFSLKELGFDNGEISPRVHALSECSTTCMVNKAFGNLGVHSNIFSMSSTSPRISQIIKNLPLTRRSFSCSFSRGVSYKELPMTEVIPHKLYIGSEQNAFDENELLGKGITHMISVTNHVHPIKGIKHALFPMHDRGKTELTNVLQALYTFMQKSQESGKKLFVHCKLGQNRSPTLVLAFLMKSKGFKLREAYTRLKDLRPLVQINRLYAKMLLKLENELFGETSVPDDWMEVTGFDSVRGELIVKDVHMGSKQRASKIKQQKVEKPARCYV